MNRRNYLIVVVISASWPLFIWSRYMAIIAGMIDMVFVFDAVGLLFALLLSIGWMVEYYKMEKEMERERWSLQPREYDINTDLPRGYNLDTEDFPVNLYGDGSGHRACFRCHSIMTFDDFKKTNKDLDHDRASMLWKNEHVSLLCCSCFLDVMHENYLSIGTCDACGETTYVNRMHLCHQCV